MPLAKITDSEARLKSLYKDLSNAASLTDINVQHVYSSHLIIASSGHIERCIADILSEYGRTHGNEQVKRFIDKTVKRNNSLSCEKIENIVNQFDAKW